MEIRTAGKSLNSIFFSFTSSSWFWFPSKEPFQKANEEMYLGIHNMLKEIQNEDTLKVKKSLCRCHFVFEWSPWLNWYSIDRPNVNFGRDFKIAEHLFWQCQSVFWTGSTFVSFRGSDRVLYAKCLSRETSISLGSCLEMLRDANCLADLDEQGAQRDALVASIQGKQKVTPNWI